MVRKTSYGMGAKQATVLEPRQLNEADEKILDQLHQGRVSPGYVDAKTDVEQTYVSQRLRRLEEHGHVRNLSRGLWELVDDPRGDVGTSGKVDVGGLQEALADARDAWERADGEAVGEALDRIGELLEADNE